MSTPKYFVWRVSALVQRKDQTSKERMVVTFVDNVPTTLSATQVLRDGLEILLKDETDDDARLQITATVSVEEVPVGVKRVFLF